MVKKVICDTDISDKGLTFIDNKLSPKVDWDTIIIDERDGKLKCSNPVSKYVSITTTDRNTFDTQNGKGLIDFGWGTRGGDGWNPSTDIIVYDKTIPAEIFMYPSLYPRKKVKIYFTNPVEIEVIVRRTAGYKYLIHVPESSIVEHTSRGIHLADDVQISFKLNAGNLSNQILTITEVDDGDDISLIFE